MPHMVVFRTNEGKPGYHWAETLDDAVRFVEHLRNNEQVAESKVYRMNEVPIEFKVMYKVEVSGAAAPAPAEDSGPADAVSAAQPSDSEGISPRNASLAENRAEPLRPTTAPGPTAAPTGTAASSPVGQTGGRFGLFSRT